jgi:hypothetical protein
MIASLSRMLISCFCFTLLSGNNYSTEIGLQKTYYTLLYFENKKEGDDFTFIDRGLVILESIPDDEEICQIIHDKERLFELLIDSKPVLLAPPCTKWEIDNAYVDSLVSLVIQKSKIDVSIKSYDGYYLYDRIVVTKPISFDSKFVEGKGMSKVAFRISNGGYITAYDCYEGFILKW